MDQGEDLLVRDTVKDSDKSADKESDSTYDMANVLGTLGAANILTSGGLRERLEIAKIHAERELEMMITKLDMSNEIVAKEKMQDFVPINFKLESEGLKRPGIQLGKESFKKLKTDEASGTKPTQEQQSREPKELSEEELKKMMELVPVEESYIGFQKDFK
nr:hypothetical protein [Tanacetum cinerariifolium]